MISVREDLVGVGALRHPDFDYLSGSKRLCQIIQDNISLLLAMIDPRASVILYCYITQQRILAGGEMVACSQSS